MSNGVLRRPSRRVFASPYSSVSIQRSFPAQLFLTSRHVSSFSSCVTPTFPPPFILEALTCSFLLAMLLFFTSSRSAKSLYSSLASFFSCSTLESAAWCASFSRASSFRSPVYPLFSMASVWARAGCSRASSALSETTFRTTAKEKVASTSSRRSPLHSSSMVFRITASRPRKPFFLTCSRQRRRAARRLRDWTWSAGGKKASSFCRWLLATDVGETKKKGKRTEVVETYALRFLGIP